MLTFAIIVAVGLIVATGLLIRFGRLPPWGHKDLLAYSAMMATVLFLLILVVFVDKGQSTFTAQANALIKDMIAGQQVPVSVGEALTTIINAQAFNHKLAMGGIIVGVLSLGLVISARTLKASGLGANIELATGADGKPALPVVAVQPPSKPIPTQEKAPVRGTPGPGELPEEQKL
jgi:hypothetical protein